LGIKKIISILKGVKSTFNIDYNLYNLATFSALQGFTSDQLETIIYNLINAELIKLKIVSEFKNMPVLILTKKGKDALENQYNFNIPFLNEFMDHNVLEFDEIEEQLFNDLKQLRYDISKLKMIAPFMICSDITLREIVTQKPTNRDSLLAVHGIGEVFCQNYGESFIEVIAKYIKTND
jgi:ATP-dependent DNA helicase RecQ